MLPRHKLNAHRLKVVCRGLIVILPHDVLQSVKEAIEEPIAVETTQFADALIPLVNLVSCIGGAGSDLVFVYAGFGTEGARLLVEALYILLAVATQPRNVASLLCRYSCLTISTHASIISLAWKSLP